MVRAYPGADARVVGVRVSAENTKALHELRRIRWRQERLRTPEGVNELADRVRKGAKEKDLGPPREESKHAEK